MSGAASANVVAAAVSCERDEQPLEKSIPRTGRCVCQTQTAQNTAGQRLFLGRSHVYRNPVRQQNGRPMLVAESDGRRPHVALFILPVVIRMIIYMVLVVVEVVLSQGALSGAALGLT